MTKAYILEHYGEEWYERHKANCRRIDKEFREKNPKLAKERRHNKYVKNLEYAKETNRKHSETYRISTRDRLRLERMDVPLDGKQVHHLKYHKDVKDASWIDDIVIMTPSEHRIWHRDHPEFVASENIV